MDRAALGPPRLVAPPALGLKEPRGVGIGPTRPAYTANSFAVCTDQAGLGREPPDTLRLVVSDPAWEAAERITQLERALAEALVHAEQLEEALMSRDIIGQAKGVLMEREHIDADAAFNELVLQSQRLNEKLRLVAERVAAAASR